jgi:TRAP-type uncharacterized transport system substrate-binding protein
MRSQYKTQKSFLKVGKKSQGREKAAQMLIQGEIDAAFFVTAYHSPVIRRFLFSKDIQLNFIQKG